MAPDGGVAADFTRACDGSGTRKLAPSEVLTLIDYASARGWHVHSMEAWRVDSDGETPELGKGMYGLRSIEKDASPAELDGLAREILREALADEGEYIFQVWLSAHPSS